MAKKTSSTRWAVKIESDSMDGGVTAVDGYEGTAMNIAQAVEESDAHVPDVHIDRTLTGTPRIQVNTAYGIGAGEPVPEELHSLLTDYDFEHAQESDRGQGSHRSDFQSHVYTKQ